MAKAWEVAGIGRDVPLGRCARLILDTRFREMMSYREGTILGEDVEQLHSMRVGSRRLRSAMRNFRECFEPEAFNHHAMRIKEIADSLGTVRDLDVRLEWFEVFLAEAPADERPGLELLIAAAWDERQAARAPMVALLERLHAEEYAKQFLDFVWAEVPVHG